MPGQAITAFKIVAGYGQRHSISDADSSELRVIRFAVACCTLLVDSQLNKPITLQVCRQVFSLPGDCIPGIFGFAPCLRRQRAI